MNATKILTDNNVKPSYIRIAVLDYLLGTKSHPTADSIYGKLAPSIPTLSKTSVYNTVKLLCESDIITSITIDGFQTRYDADMSLHGHFLCKKCGGVEDIVLHSPETFSLDGYNVKDTQVYYRGVCKDCLENK